MSAPRILDASDIEAIAEEAANRAVQKSVPAAIEAVLLGLGIPVGDPIAMQRRMSYLKDAAERSADPEYQFDRQFVRDMRVRCQAVHSAVLSKAVGLVMTALAVAVIAGMAAYFGIGGRK